MTSTLVDRDERTVAIENASFRWAYLFLSFGLLTIVAYRSFALAQSSWDLLALVVLSGVVTAAFRYRRRAMTRVASRSAVVAIVGGIVVAMVLVYATAYATKASSAVSAGMAAAKAAREASR
jgi:formate/nitrite transporter FocA (FNT family)